MLEQMKWEDIYQLWRRSGCHFPKALDEPLSAETVFVEYKKDGYIYGYDWLSTDDAQERKRVIEEDPFQFLYFTKLSNKGTIQTAEMLIEAKNEEELAAIWIAATAKELNNCGVGRDTGRYAYLLHIAACEFLTSRYYMWHHAMKKLVPEIMIPYSILESIVCKDTEPLIWLIQANTILLKNTWNILRYSSLKNEELPESHRSIRRM